MDDFIDAVRELLIEIAAPNSLADERGHDFRENQAFLRVLDLMEDMGATDPNTRH